MEKDIVLAIIGTAAFVFVLVRVFLKTLVKSTIEESVKNEFKLERQSREQEFAREMQALSREAQFRVSALEKRMEAHQKAFELAYKMLWTVHASTDARLKVSSEAQSFWRRNALYLTEQGRGAFIEAFNNYQSYDVFHALWRDQPEDKQAKENLTRAFNSIQELPTQLLRAIDAEASGLPRVNAEASITPFKKLPASKNRSTEAR